MLQRLATTLVAVVALLFVLLPVLRFAVLDAVFVGTPRPDCVQATGACWPLITQAAVPIAQGLLLSIATAAGVYACAFPLAAMLALGRSGGGLAGKLCAIWIEFFRGLPAVAVLFAAAIAAPLVVPADWLPGVYVRVFVALTCFQSAYLAEVLRGGFAAVPVGLLEAGAGLGLTPRQIRRNILWPPALRAVAPGLLNCLLGLFKDTSLLMLVGINDFLGAVEAPVHDPARSVPMGALTVYLFAGAVYYGVCSLISRRVPT